jgi:predicted DNA-binding transcriptional regulator AlpA
MSNPSQEQFDKTYITSTEIAKLLNVSRASVCNAVSRGLLPEPITLNNGSMTIFVREKVKPFVEAWRTVLDVKRAIKND